MKWVFFILVVVILGAIFYFVSPAFDLGSQALDTHLLTQ